MLVALGHGVCLAQETGLDEALGGFDQPKKERPGRSGSGLDSVLEGFGEDKPASSSGGGLDDALEGFDQPVEAVAAESKRILPDWLDLTGSLELSSSWAFHNRSPRPGRFDQRIPTKLAPELNLQADLDLAPGLQARIAGHGFYDFAYLIKGRDQYPDKYLDLYEWEIEADEVWLRGSLTDWLDIKTGRQIVVWGKSDNIRVTDVINPMDLREPGLTDIEDLRMPVAMTRADLYRGTLSLTAMMIHEVRFNKQPVYGSDYYPGSAVRPPEEFPDLNWDNQEYAVSLNGAFSGFDVSLYGARVFNDQAHMAQTPTGPVRRHARLWMGGAAANITKGSWLLKAEAAYFSGLEFYNAPNREFDRLDVLLGLEYYGFKETVISVEAVNRHLFDFDPAIKGGPEDGRENDFSTALRITRDFDHDRLTLTFLALTYGVLGQGGGLQRLQAEYELTDAVTLTAGVTLYFEGDRAFYGTWEDNDRIFFRIKYSF